MKLGNAVFAAKGWLPAVLLAAVRLISSGGGAGDLPPAPGGPVPTALIELDGTDSENPDGGELSYRWTQLDGPKVELSDPSAAKPYFRTGKPGLYRFQLVVVANGLVSDPAIVELMIERENQPPVARSPGEVVSEVGKPVEISGRDSFDPDGAGLSYRWRPLTPGFELSGVDLNGPVLSFVPEVDGVFEIELIVSDGEAVSRPSLTRLSVKPKPRPPVARGKVIPREIPTVPGAEQAMAPPGSGTRPVAALEGPSTARMGEPVMLDARGSRGRSGSRLEYLWRQKSGPFIRDFEVVFDGAAERFLPPRPGDYEFELVVADGSGESEPAVHRLRVVKDADPPVAVVVAPTRAMPGALIRMDATQSYDLGGSPLNYLWRQTGGPKVTNYVIDERLGDSAPAFYPAGPGIYSFELTVSNGKRKSRPVEVDIEVGGARRPPELRLEGPAAARAGETLALAAAVGNAEGADWLFAWRQIEGPAPALPARTTGLRAVIAPPLPGRYAFELSALKDGRTEATARHVLEVLPAAGISPPPAGGGNPYPGRPTAQIHPSVLRGAPPGFDADATASALAPLVPLN
jgi:hypothetical protein